MKICSSCNVDKNLSEFGVRMASRDGLTASCKACQSIRDKARANDPDRVKARIEYAKTPRGKAAGYKAKLAWATRNTQKRKAHVIVGNAIRDGKIFKQPCENCGATNNIEAHHEDYSYPFLIKWFCTKCHSKHHHEPK